MQPVSAIPTEALFLAFACHCGLGVLFGGVQIDHPSARWLPNTAPFSYQGPFPKKIRLHAQAIIAVHAAGRLVAFEVDRGGLRVLIAN